MDAKERNETLARLYTLRAGLSAVSEKRDEVAALIENRNKTIREIKQREEQTAAPIRRELKMQSLNSVILSKRIDYAQLHMNWEQFLNILDKDGQQEYRKNKEYYDSNFDLTGHADYQKGEAERCRKRTATAVRKQKAALGSLIVFFLLAVVCGGCSAFLSLLFLIAAIPLAVGGCIALGIYIRKGKEKRRYTLFAEEHTKLYNSAKKHIEEQERLLAETEQTYLPQIHEAEDTASIAVDTDINACSALNTALQKEFGALLDERDWKHLDLIIFYFETGRADSFKEALQQVDREVQTNRIVGAIENAGTLIARTIHMGMTALRADMVRCFSLLSEQIDSLGRQQLDAIGKLSQQVEGMSVQVKGLSAEVGKLNFSHALAAKASVSSEQLADDLHYMRTLAENAEVRRRNGL